MNPNIILILCDDLGFGDISALNTNSKIFTPNIDSIVSKGISVTDAHTTSSVCTPSRYSLLTGRYSFRSSLKSGVNWGIQSSFNRERAADFISNAQELWICHGYGREVAFRIGLEN